MSEKSISVLGRAASFAKRRLRDVLRGLPEKLFLTIFVIAFTILAGSSARWDDFVLGRELNAEAQSAQRLALPVLRDAAACQQERAGLWIGGYEREEPRI